jgi:hypothetical protein
MQANKSGSAKMKPLAASATAPKKLFSRFIKTLPFVQALEPNFS